MSDLLQEISDTDWRVATLGGVALFALGLNLYCACGGRSSSSRSTTSPSASSSLADSSSAAVVEMVEICVDSTTVATQTDMSPDSEEEEMQSVRDMRRQIKQESRRFSV